MNVCQYSPCSNRVSIVGVCKICPLKLCSKHRLPEVHSCSGLSMLQSTLKLKNAQNLMNNKTLASKIKT